MNYFQRYLAEEFTEDYQEGRIPRREALRLIVSVTGSMTLATSMLAACAPAETSAPISSPQPRAVPTASPSPDAGLAQGSTSPSTGAAPQTSPGPGAAYGTVSPGDPSVQASAVEIPGGSDTLKGYQAIPTQDGKFPIILVCHENRGLTAHIEDVTRRLAKAGYLALAVDLLSRQGGSAAVGSDAAPGALGRIDPEQFVQDFLAGYDYLKGLSQADAARAGMVGFCFGGGVTWLMATRMPELKAAVPFYGPHPPLEDVPKIQAAVLAIYGGLDQRINQGIPEIEEAMQKNGKIFEKAVFEGADHAFHNDTGSRYNPEAARHAWSLTLDWFARYV